MDFFSAQHRARQKSHWLVFWFAMAVIGTVVAVYLVALLFLHFLEAKYGSSRHPFPLSNVQLFFCICLIVGGCVVLCSLYKISELSAGGGALIASQLGGRMIVRETGVPAEKRLLNVTEEMAIAAGIPAPVVYVLDEETGLNAFAAGFTTQDSVVCVTRGLLDAMKRDELQGVIGHEISHIVNGDSRLNLKLVGLLFGIDAITVVGRVLMRVRGRKAGAIVLFGALMCIVGSVGLFFGRIIRAAVSREREYLADASAVQFTRHPLGLAAALKKLQTLGTRIRHPEAIVASHLFFANGGSTQDFFASLLATHPPLAERIGRLGGRRLSSRASKAKAVQSTKTAGVSEELSAASIAQAQSLLAGLPETLRQQTRHVAGAVGAVGGLLFSGRPDVRNRQEELLPPEALPVARELYQWLSAQPEQGARYRLVWMDLVLPCLREAPEAELRQLFVMAEALIYANERVECGDFALYTLLRGALLPPSARRVKRGELRLDRLDRDIGDLLALISHAGNEDVETAKAAYQAAIACSPVQVRHPFPERATFPLSAISRALAHLALTAPPYRKKVLHACSVAIHHDGKITPVENELFRAYAQSIDCPAPLAESSAGM